MMFDCVGPTWRSRTGWSATSTWFVVSAFRVRTLPQQVHLEVKVFGHASLVSRG